LSKKLVFIEQNTSQNTDGKLQIAQEVPPEILNSMYNDYLKNNEVQKAKNIKSAYNFKTGKRIAQSNLNLNLNVPGVGNVLDGGSFVEYSGQTQAHIEKLGWVTYSFNDMNSPFAPNAFDNTAPSIGQYMGTVGKSKRIEAFILPSVRYNFYGSLSDPIYFRYKAYMQQYGWLSQVMSPQIAGITGQSLRMEAFQINVSPQYVGMDSCLCLYQPKVYYRAHVQSIGWQSWVSAGQTAGTTGQSLRVEAMQVRVHLLQ
jgi:hypothetical protein